MNTRQILLVAATFLTFSASQVNAGAWTLTTIASFSGPNGYNPYGGVTFDAAGNLYGTTYVGGLTGTVWEITKGSSTITTLATFNASTGSGPSDSVTFDAAGNLYGTLGNYGANGYGAVFEIAKGSNAVTIVAPFNSTSGSSNFAVTFDSAGNMYGTTLGGYYDGAVWEIAKGSSTVTTLATFNSSNAFYMSSGVTFDSAGNMYGTANYGGASNDGVVWELAKGSSTITDVASFNGTNGSGPSGGVTFDAAGNMYGTVGFVGSVWEIAKGSNVITTLASFNATTGDYPQSSVVVDAAGNVYGATELGGANNAGTIWEIVKGSNTITVLASLTGYNGDYSNPFLTFDASGNLYGVNSAGGAYNEGYVFELTNPNPLTPTAVPEPSTIYSLLAGVATLAGYALRRRARRAA